MASCSRTPHQANRQEVTSNAIQEARRATRLAEAEARKCKLECDRLARKIHDLEQSSSQSSPATTPTSYNTGSSSTNTSSTNTKHSRPANIITDFSHTDDPFHDGLATGGLKTALPTHNPKRLLRILGKPRSTYSPARAPIPKPLPPYPDCAPRTPEGRRRSAERMINSPARERALAAERAYLAASNAAWYEFEESRSDRYALNFTLLRKNINIPVRKTLGRMVGIAEEGGHAEDEADDDEEEEEQEGESENDDESSRDEEVNVSLIDPEEEWF